MMSFASTLTYDTFIMPAMYNASAVNLPHVSRNDLALCAPLCPIRLIETKQATALLTPLWRNNNAPSLQGEVSASIMQLVARFTLIRCSDSGE